MKKIKKTNFEYFKETINDFNAKEMFFAAFLFCIMIALGIALFFIGKDLFFTNN